MTYRPVVNVTKGNIGFAEDVTLPLKFPTVRVAELPPLDAKAVN
jgi:hypothetical protein